jgi:serine protease Do
MKSAIHKLLAGCLVAAIAAATPLAAQRRQGFAQRSGGDTVLGQMSDAFRKLADRVSVSTVKIVAVGYRPLDEQGAAGISARQQSGGSGVIVDPEGYIVTNAHVVAGAQRLQVVLSPRLDRGVKRESILKPSTKILKADLVGMDFETDLAVLKVNEVGLPALKFGDSDLLAPGQLVLAFGSPLGLRNSVSMGVISSQARQLRPEDPMIYLQTDTAINPGNSGGPLVNTDGQVVGINTLIFSQSGGSEGIGFAAPSNIVANVYRHIREKGRMVRGEIGVLPQTITPTMAAGLKLAQPYGVILGDVFPGSPADQAALRPGDIVLTLDGKPMENARQFVVNLYRPAIGDMVKLEILRGRDKKTVPVKVVERPNDPSRFASLVTSSGNKIDALGIFAFDLSPEVKQLLPPLRRGLGVLVASRTADAPYLENNFRPGDVIYLVNGEPVTNVGELQAALSSLQTGEPVTAQIERNRQLQFLAFQLP